MTNEEIELKLEELQKKFPKMNINHSQTDIFSAEQDFGGNCIKGLISTGDVLFAITLHKGFNTYDNLQFCYHLKNQKQVDNLIKKIEKYKIIEFMLETNGSKDD